MQIDQAEVYADQKRVLYDAKDFISFAYYQSVYFSTKKELKIIDKINRSKKPD